MKNEAKQYYDLKRSAYSDSANRQPSTVPLNLEGIEKIHISGVCGKFMASFAGILKKLNYEITGSDEVCYPPMSNVLQDIGVPCQEYSRDLVDRADITIVANVAGPNQVEAAYAREGEKAYLSAPEFLGERILKNTKSIVIAGTHGKTTTTSIASHLFSQWNNNTGFLIGGVLNKPETSFYIPSEQPDYFIIEGDEYDTAYFDKGPKFLHYHPYYAVITSIELDHIDIYKDFGDYKQAFQFLTQEVHKDGVLFISEEVQKVELNLSKTDCEVVVYGLSEISDIKADNITYTSQGMSFDLFIKGDKKGNIQIPLFGNYNVMNVLPLCAMALWEGMPLKTLCENLKTFPGVQQRQQILFSNQKTTLIRDFAHHPTAVDKTLEAFRLGFPDKKIICVFEPRSSSSRRKIFLEPYAHSFRHADVVLLSQPKMRENDSKEDFISIDDMELKTLEYFPDLEIITSYDSQKIFEELKTIAIDNSIIIFMSNGYFSGIDSKFVDFLNTKNQ